MRLLTILSLLITLSTHASDGAFKCDLSPGILSTLNMTIPLDLAEQPSSGVYLAGSGRQFFSLRDIWHQNRTISKFVSTEAGFELEVKVRRRQVLKVDYSFVSGTGTAKIWVDGRYLERSNITCAYVTGEGLPE